MRWRWHRSNSGVIFYWCCIASYFRQSQISRPTSRVLRGRIGNKIHKQKYYRVVVQDGLRTRSILPSHRTVPGIISINLGCQQTCVHACLIFISKAITTKINKLKPYFYWEIKKECPVTCRGVTMHNLKLINYWKIAQRCFIHFVENNYHLQGICCITPEFYFKNQMK